MNQLYQCIYFLALGTQFAGTCGWAYSVFISMAGGKQNSNWCIFIHSLTLSLTDKVINDFAFKFNKLSILVFPERCLMNLFCFKCSQFNDAFLTQCVKAQGTKTFRIYESLTLGSLAVEILPL
jgi:hypothetical protein